MRLIPVCWRKIDFSFDAFVLGLNLLNVRINRVLSYSCLFFIQQNHSLQSREAMCFACLVNTKEMNVRNALNKSFTIEPLKMDTYLCDVYCCFIGNDYEHDDVIKCKHFPRYWPFVRGIHRSPVNSPHKGQWRGALMFSLICSWINDWVNNREAGEFRRHERLNGKKIMKDTILINDTKNDMEYVIITSRLIVITYCMY